MTARGFCTCKRDHPGNVLCHPAPGASWHYLCDKPVLPPREPLCRTCGFTHPAEPDGCPRWAPEPPRIVPTGTGWPA